MAAAPVSPDVAPTTVALAAALERVIHQAPGAIASPRPEGERRPMKQFEQEQVV